MHGTVADFLGKAIRIALFRYLMIVEPGPFVWGSYEKKVFYYTFLLKLTHLSLEKYILINFTCRCTLLMKCEPNNLRQKNAHFNGG